MKIVILGGVAAGAKAAAKARRLLPDAEIDLYTDDTHVSYSACGLPYYIQGNFTEESANDLVDLINSGSMPAKLTEVSSNSVGASFGTNALVKTVTAGIIGIGIIIVLLIALYRFSGLIASVGIIIYTSLTFFIFWLLGGTMTLSGIAAMIIGIGMAVDSNVINFNVILLRFKLAIL